MKEKNFIFFVLTFLVLNSVYSLEEIQVLSDPGNETLEELYMHVNISYMESVVSDLSELIEAYPFYDILQNPPNPYQDLKVDMANLFKDIKINESRPFYEFYQDIKTTFKKLSDSVFEIIGDEIPINGEIIKFSEYHICLSYMLLVSVVLS